ncbi:MAG: hypothetical protein ACUVWJ_01045 [Spirochaetota bacterium]
MYGYDKLPKTILLAIHRPEDRESILKVLSPAEYRIILAEDLISLFDFFQQHRIDLLIAESDFPGVSMCDFLSFLRYRYGEIKVIIAMKEYSVDRELLLRQHKILYVMRWPLNGELLNSIVMRGLGIERGVGVPS